MASFWVGKGSPKLRTRSYKEALDHVYSTIVKLPDDQVGTKVYMETASKGLARYGNSYNKDVLWGAILKNIKAANLAENSPQPYMALDKEYVFSESEGYFYRREHLAQ